MTYQKLGQFIKQERKKKKMTQQDLANSVNVTKRTIQYIEAGEHFHIATLDTVLNILGFKLELNVKEIKNEI